MSERHVLAFAIFAVLIIVLLEEIAWRLQNVKIIVAIPRDPGNVIEGEAREVPASDAT